MWCGDVSVLCVVLCCVCAMLCCAVLCGAVFVLCCVVLGCVVLCCAVPVPGAYTHLRAHETKAKLVCRLLLEKKKTNNLFNH